MYCYNTSRGSYLRQTSFVRFVLAVLFVLAIFVLTGQLHAQSLPQANQNPEQIAETHAQRFADLQRRALLIDDNGSAPELNPEMAVRYPLKYWRQWANQKLPFPLVLGFVLTIVTVIQLIAGNILTPAKVLYETHLLRMFGVGATVSVLGCIIAGFMNRLGLFAPSGVVVLAVIQLANLAGLTIASQSIGGAIFKLLKLHEWQQKSKFGEIASLWCGAFLLCLIVAIPGLGALPRLGNRLLFLISASGAGAVFTSVRKSVMAQKEI